MFFLLFVEKRLDSYVTSQRNRDAEKTDSHHSDTSPSTNVAHGIERRQLSCEFTGSGKVTTFSDLCHSSNILRSTLNKSELKADCDSGANNRGSANEILYDDVQEEFSIDIPRTVVHPLANSIVSASEQNVVEIDKNCNELFPSEPEPDLNVEESSNDSVIVGDISDKQASLSLDCDVDDGVTSADPLSQETYITTDSLQDTSGIVTV